MKHIFVFIATIGILTTLSIGCNDSSVPVSGFLPQPTDTTYIENLETGEHKELKKYWFEAIHKSAPGTDWRVVERNNAIDKYDKLVQNQDFFKSNSKDISVANGALVAKWQEKGSLNLAGSITKTDYNKHDKLLYAMASGGSIWKSDIVRFNWSVVEESLRFDQDIFSIVYPPGEDYRLISSIGGIPYYMDGSEQIWHPASGLNDNFVYDVKDLTSIISGKYIFLLTQQDEDSPVTLVYSKDYGTSFQMLKEFDTNLLQEVSLTSDGQKNEVYVVERKNYISADFFKFNRALDRLELKKAGSSITFGDDLANISVSNTNGVVTFLCYDNQQRLYRSTNYGSNWSQLSQLPARPWEVGIKILPSNPDIVMFGAIEAYRSINGGRTWAKVNNWYDYYSNQSTTLHADIMDIAEYSTDTDGEVLIVANHGGVSKSNDKGEDFQNMALTGLNISQYYSVRTYPHDNRYIFAGSQDQGLQRGKDIEDGPANFTQFIPGDYGHLQFTNNGRSLWAIYPGGWVIFYNDPTETGSLSVEFELLTNNQSVWLPPILTSPYDPNSILIAGGSHLGNNGSHIVELTVDDFSQLFVSQWPTNFKTGGGEVSALEYNKANIEEIYVLTTNGKFFKSTNRGISFQEKTDGLSEANELYGSTILSSKKDPNKVIIGGSGYSNPSIFVSNDAGESFQPMTDGLPPTSVFELCYNQEEDFIFAATEAGPYVYSTVDNKWYELTQGKAPNQTYWSVEYLQESNTIRYGTYGRGIWDLNITETTATSETVEDSNPISVFPNPSENVFHVQSTKSTGILSLLDSKGKLILSKDLQSNSDFKFDLSSFSNGLYYVIFDDGKTKSSNIIVKI